MVPLFISPIISSREEGMYSRILDVLPFGGKSRLISR